MTLNLPIWPYVYGSPSGQGIIRHHPADFQVTEQLSFEPSGDGEHVFLQIQKTGENTDYVARQLARIAGVRQRDIGYAGIKDRHAVTTQWFSVWLPGLKPDPDWSALTSEQLTILHTIRHARKLKRGVLAANHFKLRIRQWQGDRDTTLQQLERIKTQGIPNYYGEQRFGHGGQNVSKALAMFQGRKTSRDLRSLYLSAARAYLFNHLLAQRVEARNWNQAVSGEVLSFDLSHSRFHAQQIDASILARVAAYEIHPTGLLWGKGSSETTDAAFALEQAIIATYPELAQGLLDFGVALDRRALRVNVQQLCWQFTDAQTLVLDFSLPAGCYATAVLRELIEIPS